MTQSLKELTALGLVCQIGTIGCTGGRRATAYALVSQAVTAAVLGDVDWTMVGSATVLAGVLSR